MNFTGWQNEKIAAQEGTNFEPIKIQFLGTNLLQIFKAKRRDENKKSRTFESTKGPENIKDKQMN